MPRNLPRLCLATALLAVAVVGTHSASATTPSRSGSCGASFNAPASDAASLYFGGPNDGDLDVTHVALTVRSTTVTSTVTFAGGGGTTPGLGTAVETQLISGTGSSVQSVTFGYWRSASFGGGPSLYSSRTPVLASTDGDPTLQRPAVDTGLTVRYDDAHSQVSVTVPRSDLERALGHSLSTYAADQVIVRSATVDPAPSYRPRTVDDGAMSRTAVSFAACDRSLPRQTASSAGPCSVDIATGTGDEESFAPVGQAEVRDDSLDVTHVTYTLTPKDLVATLTIARLTGSPVVGTGQGYAAKFSVANRFLVVGAYRDSRAGTHPFATLAGVALPDPPAVAVRFDSVRQQVVLTMSRADLAKALGTPTARTVANVPGAVTDARVNGRGLFSVDEDANDPTQVLSFARCDKATRTR